MPDAEPLTRAGVPAAFAPIATFVRELRFADLPRDVVEQAMRCLLDLCGVAAAGSTTRASSIARSFAASQLGTPTGGARMLFDRRHASAAGAAFAGATTIDAVDAHDGHALTKGHAGVGVLPALLALLDAGEARSGKIRGPEFLTALVLGYEIAIRAGIAQHASVPDYHCSGSWNALGCAAVGARWLRLDERRAREALGIAEYFGPRGQMLRTCEHPSMVKDGSGWGAHAGVSAVLLAREGFTGAPALVVERGEARPLWQDLGERWRIREQYFKAYPVCRWAQPAIEAVLALQRAHHFRADDVAMLAIESFREAVGLGAGCALPASTEDAQYSLTYPVATALAFGRVGVEEIGPRGWTDARVQRLLRVTRVVEDARFSQRFPAERWARVRARLADGRDLVSEPARARGDPETPLRDAELRDKYRKLAEPVLGADRAAQIERLVHALPVAASSQPLADQLLTPP